jgi:hypothetical protein
MYKQKFKRLQISKDVVLKSGLEEVVYKYLTSNKCKFVYEGIKITYFQPETKKTYTPDFPIDGCFIVETKGNFNSADRNKIGKKSQTTYGKWCELNNFPYHCIQSTKETFPSNWLKEITEKQYGKRTD